MKTNFTFFTISCLIVLLLHSCTKDEKTSVNEFISEITLNETCNYKFYYNDLGKLIKHESWFPPLLSQETYEYDSVKNVIFSQYFENDILISESKYFWQENTMERINYNVNQNVVEEAWKSIYRYNSNGEVEQIDEYLKDNNSWVKIAYFIYHWSNGNLIKAELWNTVQISLKNKKISQFQSERFEMLPLSENKSEPTKHAEVTYEYDSENNPMQILSIRKIVYPDSYLNYSQNNVVQSLYSDIENITYSENITYTYTETDSPNMKTLSFEESYPDETITGSTKWHYSYEIIK
jgi:hypothetical protein